MKNPENKAFARRASSDGMVLLKNDGALPLKEGPVAIFGRAAYYTFKGGSGSGDVLSAKTVSIYNGLKNTEIELFESLCKYCDEYNTLHSDDYKHMNRNWFQWTHKLPEIPIGKEMIKEASDACETAVVVLGRIAGEATDIELTKGDWYLSDEEDAMLATVCNNFSKVVLLLNFCSSIDTSFLRKYNFSAIVYVGLGGEETGNAVADVLSGKTNPSGKLASTWAKSYDDFPATSDFSTLQNCYNEGIFVGYRYFDTFGIEPQYSFGFGLSYTEFEISLESTRLCGSVFEAVVKVTNKGNAEGREVVQCYLSSPGVSLEQPYQALATFKKTAIIKPGQCEFLTISFDMEKNASYCEKSACFVLEGGEYIVRIGNSSRNTHVAAKIIVSNSVVCRKTSNRLGKPIGLSEISNFGAKPYTYQTEAAEIKNATVLMLSPDAIKATQLPQADGKTVCELKNADNEKTLTLIDVIRNNAKLKDLVTQMSNRELALMVNGFVYENNESANSNVGGMSRKVQGAGGETVTIEKYGIPETICADGPAGLRFGEFNKTDADDSELAKKCVAYPTGTAIANTWDVEIAAEFGRMIYMELEYAGVDGWLAPGVNIHRSPLCGRNFEYFSEDPIVSGLMAAAQIKGVQEQGDGSPTGFYATIKHFVCNEQEFARDEADSIVSERALREIYLKPFEIAVELAQPIAIMTSYNKVNGTYTANSYDLLTAVLRHEWGYNGIVMTDWNGKALTEKIHEAGNDLIMPGLDAVLIEKGLNDGSISKGAVQRCALRIIEMVIKTVVERGKKK